MNRKAPVPGPLWSGFFVLKNGYHLLGLSLAGLTPALPGGPLMVCISVEPAPFGQEQLSCEGLAQIS